MRRLNRKGSMMDSIYVPIFILTIAMTAIIGLFIWHAFSSNFGSVVTQGLLQGTLSSDHATLINSTIANVDLGMSAIDYSMPLIVIGLLIVSLIFSFKTGSGVVYAVISIVLWGFALMLSLLFSDIFEQFAASFPVEAGQYAIIVFIMANMKWIVLAWLFLTGVVMLTRNKKDQQMINASEMAFGGLQ